jgi:acetoacetate decarboxylase
MNRARAGKRNSWRDFDAERLRGLEIDPQLDFRSLLEQAVRVGAMTASGQSRPNWTFRAGCKTGIRSKAGADRAGTQEIAMKKEDVLRQYTTPTGAPAFVPGPHRFTSREYLNITYRTDREALVKQVPEPLEIDEPLVRFEVMNMPDTTGYGSYVECGQAAVVRHGEERGEYIIGMYLDNLPAIAAGRELSAFPKKLGSAKLFVDSDTLVGTLDYGVLSVARATMGYKHKPYDLEKAREEICVPTYMLKILPSYTKRPRICELVRTQITNIEVKGAWRGPARLQLFEHVLAPLADLPVREIVSATHILTDLTLSPATVIYDY